MEQQTNKSLYDTGAGEIFSRHFLAGFAQNLGGFVVTLLSWVVIYFIVVKLVLPQVSGTIEQLNNTLKLIPKVGGTTQPSGTNKGTTIQIPENLLQQLQKGQ